MTTWQLLERSFGADQICPGRMWEDIIALPVEQLAKYRVFRGHFLSYLEPYLGCKFQTFTILRDPVQKTISHYYHARRSPEHPFYAEANSLSLARFCLDPRTRHMVDNYQSRYLACTPTKDPGALAAKMTPGDLALYKLQLALDPDVNEFSSPDELYRATRRRLAQFVAIGITERLQDSLSLIARALRLTEPPPLPIRNAGWNRPTVPCDGATERIIRSLTQVDQAVYEGARKALERELCAAATIGWCPPPAILATAPPAP